MKNKVFIIGCIIASFCIYANANVIDRVIIIVNDEPVLLSELNKGIEGALQYMVDSNPQWFEGAEGKVRYENEKKKLEQDKEKILELIIENKLMKQEAKARDIVVTEVEVDMEVNRLKESFPTDEAFHEALSKEGITFEELREEKQGRIMVRKLISREMSTGMPIDDNAIEEYYHKHKAEFSEESVHLKQIQNSDEKLINEAWNELKAGKEFSGVVKKYANNEEIKAKGGDIGTLSIAELDGSIIDAIKDLRIGEFSKPVKIGENYRIFKLEDKMPGKQLLLTDTINIFNEEIPLKQFIKDKLNSDKWNEKYANWIKELKTKATIERK